MQSFLRPLLFTLLLGGALLALPVHAEDLTPTQVADLYLKITVEADLESAQKLNDYLREDLNGENVIILERFKNIRSTFIDGTVEDFMEVGLNNTMSELKPHVLEFSTAMYDAMRRARCTVGESAQDESTATVHFTCIVPDIEPTRRALGVLLTNKSSADAVKTFLTTGTAAYREAPLTQTIEGELLLERSPYGKWRCADPFDALYLIVLALKFSYFWLEF